MYKTTVLCPRCERRHYTPYERDYKKGDPPFPALSRMDNKTYICSECGTDEAMRDFGGLAPIMPEHWPIEKG